MHKYLHREVMFSKILIVIFLGSTFFFTPVLADFFSLSVYYIYIRKWKEAAFYLEKN